MALDNVSLRWPAGFDLGKDFLDNFGALRTYNASFIGQDAAWPQYAACLFEETLDVEPMQGLCNGNQVNRAGIDAGGFRGRNAKFYLWMWLRRGDLPLARVRCQDVLEVRGEGARGLAVAGGAVPRELMILTKCCQKGKQRFRIAGPVRSVAAGVAGKMILEADIGFMRGLQ